jgi:hypothetical protein
MGTEWSDDANPVGFGEQVRSETRAGWQVSPLPQGMPVQYPAPPDCGVHHAGFRRARQAAGDGGLRRSADTSNTTGSDAHNIK